MLWIFDKYIDTNLISSYHKRHQKITFISKGSIPSLASRMRRKTVVTVAPAAVRRHRRRKITFISKGLIPSSRWGMTVGGTIVARVVAVVVGAEEEAVVVARVVVGAVAVRLHLPRKITFTLKGSIPSLLRWEAVVVARVAAGVGVVAAVVGAPPHRLRRITFTLKGSIPSSLARVAPGAGAVAAVVVAPPPEHHIHFEGINPILGAGATEKDGICGNG